MPLRLSPPPVQQRQQRSTPYVGNVLDGLNSGSENTSPTALPFDSYLHADVLLYQQAPLAQQRRRLPPPLFTPCHKVQCGKIDSVCDGNKNTSTCAPLLLAPYLGADVPLYRQPRSSSSATACRQSRCPAYQSTSCSTMAIITRHLRYCSLLLTCVLMCLCIGTPRPCSRATACRQSCCPARASP